MASCVNRMWDRDRPKGERCKGHSRLGSRLKSNIFAAVPWRGIECGIEIDRRVNSAEVETKLILEVEQQLHVDVGGDRFHVNFGALFSLAPSCTARLYMLKALGWLRLDPEYSNDGSYMSATYSSETGFVFTALPYPPRAMSTLFTASTSAQDSSVAVWLLAATSTLRRDRTNLVFEFGIQRTSSRLAHRPKIARSLSGFTRQLRPFEGIARTWCLSLVSNEHPPALRIGKTLYTYFPAQDSVIGAKVGFSPLESMLHDGREHMDVGAGEGSNNKLELLDADVSARVGVEALGRCFGIAVKLRRSETVHVWSESEIVFCSNWLQIKSSVVFLTRADPLDNFCCNCLAMELWDVFCYSCGYVADNTELDKGQNRDLGSSLRGARWMLG
ncbi:hypothetical protein C8F04DRAFT_1197196 [Mycena alexandri]|uniref:Uncharacterized protein n=1 Tax=Mycena alexandri TaxID=1745969 RepID=A0AAD6WML5_9AGAR|nr:hypothetical protein C8F04DRAFT_1197196 [Mycena alexandri]